MRNIRNIVLSFAIIGGLFFGLTALDDDPATAPPREVSSPVETAGTADTAATATEGAPPTQASGEGGIAAGFRSFLGGVFGRGSSARSVKITAFPRAYDAWRRTDYLGLRNAQQALEDMARLVGRPIPEAGDDDVVTGRTAALYTNDDARDVFLIFVEIRRPTPRTRIDPTQTPPPPPSTKPTATGLSLGELERRLLAGESTISAVSSATTEATDTDRQPPPAAEAQSTGPAIELGGRRFIDRSEGRRGVVDLEAVYNDRITFILKGRTSLRIAESFVLDFNFGALGAGP